MMASFSAPDADAPNLALLAPEADTSYRDLDARERCAFLRALRHQLAPTAYRRAGNWADAEEDLQETLIATDRDGKKGERTFALVLKSWTVLENECHDRVRRQRALKRGGGLVRSLEEKTEVHGGELPGDAGATDGEAAAERDEMLALLRRAMERLLKPEECTYLALHFRGLTNAEIGAMYGVKEDTMKHRVQKAKGKLVAAAPALAPLFAAHVAPDAPRMVEGLRLHAILAALWTGHLPLAYRWIQLRAPSLT